MKARKAISFLTFLLLCITPPLLSQDASFVWAKKMGGTLFDSGVSITIDGSGNTYTTGYFDGTADFDPGAGEAILTSNGADDIFIQKLNADGDFIWAKQIGGANQDRGHSIAVDANGNIYATGYFGGTADFDPGVEEVSFTALGFTDIFILKLDTNGDFLWARQMGNSALEDARSISVDASGNVYSTGTFEGTVDFDPGAETVNLVSDTGTGAYIQKLDTDGLFIWAKQMAGTLYNSGLSITTDDLGNIYTTGTIFGTTDLDPGPAIAEFTSETQSDVFVQKLNAAGDFLWAKQIMGSFDDYSASISVDASGNVYTTGNFRETADFDPGKASFELTSVGQSDVFIQKLDADGNFLWAKQLGDVNEDEGSSVAIDATGNVYVTGFFKGIVDFDTGPSETILTSIGVADIFILKIDSNGDFIWAKQIGGTSNDRGFSIALDAFENIYTTGQFFGTADFDPGEGMIDLTAAGGTDVFILKLSPSGTVGVRDFEFDVKISVYPNPSSGIFNIEFEKPIAHALLTLTDINGKLISTQQIKNTAKANVEIIESSGIYLLTIKLNEGQKTIQLVKE